MNGIIRVEFSAPDLELSRQHVHVCDIQRRHLNIRKLLCSVFSYKLVLFISTPFVASSLITECDVRDATYRITIRIQRYADSFQVLQNLEEGCIRGCCLF